MQKTLQNIGDTALLFLVIFGGLHISTSLLLAQGTRSAMDVLIFNVVDLPFLMAALLYGTAHLSFTLEEITGNLKIPLVVCSALAVLAFLAALYLNFGLADANLF